MTKRTDCARLSRQRVPLSLLIPEVFEGATSFFRRNEKRCEGRAALAPFATPSWARRGAGYFSSMISTTREMVRPSAPLVEIVACVALAGSGPKSTLTWLEQYAVLRSSQIFQVNAVS